MNNLDYKLSKYQSLLNNINDINKKMVYLRKISSYKNKLNLSHNLSQIGGEIMDEIGEDNKRDLEKLIREINDLEPKALRTAYNSLLEEQTIVLEKLKQIKEGVIGLLRKLEQNRLNQLDVTREKDQTQLFMNDLEKQIKEKNALITRYNTISDNLSTLLDSTITEFKKSNPDAKIADKLETDKKIDLLESEILRLKALLLVAKNKIRTLTEKNIDLRTQNNALEEELRNLKAQLNDKQKIITNDECNSKINKIIKIIDEKIKDVNTDEKRKPSDKVTFSSEISSLLENLLSQLGKKSSGTPPSSPIPRREAEAKAKAVTAVKATTAVEATTAEKIEEEVVNMLFEGVKTRINMETPREFNKNVKDIDIEYIQLLTKIPEIITLESPLRQKVDIKKLEIVEKEREYEKYIRNINKKDFETKREEIIQQLIKYKKDILRLQLSLIEKVPNPQRRMPATPPRPTSAVATPTPAPSTPSPPANLNIRRGVQLATPSTPGAVASPRAGRGAMLPTSPTSPASPASSASPGRRPRILPPAPQPTAVAAQPTAVAAPPAALGSSASPGADKGPNRFNTRDETPGAPPRAPPDAPPMKRRPVTTEPAPLPQTTQQIIMDRLQKEGLAGKPKQ